MSARDDIQAEMGTLGLPTDTVDVFLAAVTAAGYDLVPTGGGSAIDASTMVGATVNGVTGFPGWLVVNVEVVSGKFARVLSVPDGQGGRLQVAAGTLTSSSGTSS